MHVQLSPNLLPRLLFKVAQVMCDFFLLNRIYLRFIKFCKLYEYLMNKDFRNFMLNISVLKMQFYGIKILNTNMLNSIKCE